VRELEFGGLRVAGAFILAPRMTDGVAFLIRELDSADGPPGPLEPRKFADWYADAGLGVVLELPEGSFNLLFDVFIGVFATGLVVAEASDMGGEGGVGVSETVSVVDTDLVSGGVVIIGEEAVEVGEPTRDGEFGVL
jgi:hypothetical protein